MKLKEQLEEMGLTEEQAQKIADEVINGSYVPKSRFNEINEENKTLKQSLADRDKQLEDLQKSNSDNAALQEQITRLQQENADREKTHAAEIKRLKIDTAVELALSAAKAKNAKAVKALLDLEKAELAEDGTVKGLAEQVKALSEAADSSFLFEQGNKLKDFKGFNPGESGDKPPTGGKAPEEMTYEELCAYFEENPSTKL